jgi:Family of unknown function (DUF6521)
MPDYKTSWDLSWDDRPSEEARNFNPAFCAELVFRTVADFRKSKPLPFNFALSFLILPIALHKATRDQLPGKASTAFMGWIADHGPLLAELPDRVARLVPITREAILFATQHRALAIEDGGVVPGSSPFRISARPAQQTDDVAEARSAAALLGRWFAAQGSAPSILQGFGVSP